MGAVVTVLIIILIVSALASATYVSYKIGITPYSIYSLTDKNRAKFKASTKQLPAFIVLSLLAFSAYIFGSMLIGSGEMDLETAALYSLVCTAPVAFALAYKF